MKNQNKHVIHSKNVFPKTVLGVYWMEFKNWLWAITHPQLAREMDDCIRNMTFSEIKQKDK